MSQSSEMLTFASEVRLEMASTRRELRALSYVTAIERILELLEDEDPAVARMRVGYLLRSVKGLGEVRARRAVAVLGSQTLIDRRVGPGEFKDRTLSRRQRVVLSAHLSYLACQHRT